MNARSTTKSVDNQIIFIAIDDDRLTIDLEAAFKDCMICRSVVALVAQAANAKCIASFVSIEFKDCSVIRLSLCVSRIRAECNTDRCACAVLLEVERALFVGDDLACAARVVDRDAACTAQTKDRANAAFCTDDTEVAVARDVEFSAVDLLKLIECAGKRCVWVETADSDNVRFAVHREDNAGAVACNGERAVCELVLTVGIRRVAISIGDAVRLNNF